MGRTGEPPGPNPVYAFGGTYDARGAGTDADLTQMRIVVVRHGQAEPKKGWNGPDELRPLTSRGRRQAKELGRLIDSRPDRILSSPAVRCRETVEPLARDFSLEIEFTESLSIEAGRDAMALGQKLAASEPAGSVIVLCSHREVMVKMLPQLARAHGRKLGHRPPGAKGGAWILRFDQGQLVRVDYRPPAA